MSSENWIGMHRLNPNHNVDDGIFLGNDDSKLTDAIRDIQNSGLNIEDQGHPADYVGVNIKKMKNGSYEFTQRALIDSIIEDVGLKDAKVKPVPAKVSLRLHAFNDEPTGINTPTGVQEELEIRDRVETAEETNTPHRQTDEASSPTTYEEETRPLDGSTTTEDTRRRSSRISVPVDRYQAVFKKVENR